MTENEEHAKRLGEIAGRLFGEEPESMLRAYAQMVLRAGSVHAVPAEAFAKAYREGRRIGTKNRVDDLDSDRMTSAEVRGMLSAFVRGRRAKRTER